MAPRLSTARSFLAPLLLCASCVGEPTSLKLNQPDGVEFREKVYPILLRDCGFAACHGGPERFFRVFGPGRTRLDPMLASDDPPTEEEISQSYLRTISMLVNESSLADSLLLRKPLDTSAGGAAHAGEDQWGHNIYMSTHDPRHVALVHWAYSRTKNAEVAP